MGNQILPAFMKSDIGEQFEESNFPLRIDLPDFFRLAGVQKEGAQIVIAWGFPKDIMLAPKKFEYS